VTHGPIRDALERIKDFAEAFGVPIEQAADSIDLMMKQISQREELEQERPGVVLAPGPERKQ